MDIKAGMRIALGDWLCVDYLTVTFTTGHYFEALESWTNEVGEYSYHHDWIHCDSHIGFSDRYPRSQEFTTSEELNILTEELID